MASAVESVLIRVKVALVGATGAGDRVERDRDDAWSPEEFCAINILRTDSDTTAFSDKGDLTSGGFEIEFFADGDAWASEADALHAEAHAILLADTELAGLCKGLRLSGTSPVHASADRPISKLIARYRFKCLTRSGDITRAIT